MTEPRFYCAICKATIGSNVFQYSMDKFGKALCIDHQKKSTHQQSSTQEAIKLAEALKQRGWKVELEKFDGYKHIDIAVTQARVNIEVDGLHHSTTAKQALADLKRSYHSFRKGYLTLRIPNCLVQDDDTLECTADYLSDFMNENDVNIFNGP